MSMIISVELCQTVIPIFGQQVQRSQSAVPGQAGVSKGNTGPLGFAHVFIVLCLRFILTMPKFSSVCQAD